MLFFRLMRYQRNLNKKMPGPLKLLPFFAKQFQPFSHLTAKKMNLKKHTLDQVII